MEKKVIDKNGLFLAWKQGNQDALVELLVVERAYLFDYLIRMTGDRSRSEDAVFEITQLMPKQAVQYATYAQCRKYLFKAVRESCLDIWNSDTALLTEDLRTFKGDGSLKDKIVPFAAALRSLAGPLRECVLLVHRLHFDIVDAAEIMGESVEKVKSGEVQTIKALLTGVAGSPQEAVNLLGRLPLFDWPIVSGHTQDIHDLVANVRERSREKLYKLAMTLLVIFIILASAWLVSRYLPGYSLF